jgi:hypothetical protein
MVRIAAIKRDDGRFEAEGVVFDPPRHPEWGGIGFNPAGTIIGAIFARMIAASPEHAHFLGMLRDLQPDNLHLKTCDDCGAYYLDGRSNRHRAWKTKRRCAKCFARQRYAYVQRSRSWRRKLSPACAQCGAHLTGRSDRKFCSGKCRIAAHRLKRRPPARHPSASVTSEGKAPSGGFRTDCQACVRRARQ